jgi:hypothetical protein
LVLALEEFRSLGIDFVSHQEALDTSTPMGKAMFTIIGAMAELERSVIRDRVMAGLEYARKHGTKSGRSIGRPRVLFRRDQVKELPGLLVASDCSEDGREHSKCPSSMPTLGHRRSPLPKPLFRPFGWSPTRDSASGSVLELGLKSVAPGFCALAAAYERQS